MYGYYTAKHYKLHNIIKYTPPKLQNIISFFGIKLQNNIEYMATTSLQNNLECSMYGSKTDKYYRMYGSYSAKIQIIE